MKKVNSIDNVYSYEIGDDFYINYSNEVKKNL